MTSLVPWIRLAGWIHLAVIATNILLPKKLAVRENAARLSPIVRQVLYVHWVYIGIVLLLFAVLCLLFPGDLAGASPLGTLLSGFLCFFWGLRIVLQLAVYDGGFRRAHPWLDAAYLLALSYFTVLFGLAAWGGRQ